jgi:site-specific DNA recombinase
MTRIKEDSYGKSTTRARDESEWLLLEKVKVVSPVVTWEEFEAIQQRMNKNNVNADRNTKRFYLLAGMLFCGLCGRRMFANHLGKDNYYRYRCPRRKDAYIGMQNCTGHNVPGRTTENQVWEHIAAFLKDPEIFMAEIEKKQSKNDNGESEIQRQLETLEKRLAKVDSMDTELVSMKLRDEIITEVYERNLALNKAERTHISEEIDR